MNVDVPHNCLKRVGRGGLAPLLEEADRSLWTTAVQDVPLALQLLCIHNHCHFSNINGPTPAVARYVYVCVVWVIII